MTDANLQEENADLRRRLEEAEEVIRAIHSGAVDAVVVAEPHGTRVYTLQTADRPYRLLVEEMQQGALTLSDDGTIAYCNRRFADLVGRPLERLMGVAFSDFIPLDAKIYYESLLHQGRAGFSQGESHVQNADGGLVPVFLTFNALPSDCGAAVGVLVTDLTTQRHQEKLNAALAALKEAVRLKDEFLATLAHELRNPLAPLRNGLQVMKLAKNNAAAIEQVRAMMERQLEQMVRLIDDLLDVSRISRGKVELKKERVELAKVVQQAVENSRPLIDQASHELLVNVPPDPIYVDADVTRLAQVFTNLLNNAAKYTERGGRIWLTVERQGSDAVVMVRDNGVGISVHLLPRIFEIFTQVDRSLEKSQGGLGIGLSLVKGLVEMHSGTVEARSDGLGAGSEFVVRLPVVATAPATEAAPKEARPVGSPAGRRILVVDDNEDAALSLAIMLKIMGNEVRTAHDGAQAVTMAEVFQPDVILMDIGMPKLNGYEACRRIRAQPWAKEAILIALTGWGQDEDKRRSHEAGFTHHLVKPVDPAILEKLLAATGVCLPPPPYEGGAGGG